MAMHLFLLSTVFCSISANAASVFQNLEFGVASAPAQSEDGLEDSWEDWGRQGRIAGWKTTPRASDRLQFWSKPEEELDLAAKSGSTIFRFGLDWGRIMPSPHTFNLSVIEHYRQMIRMIHLRKMKVMLTMMHHSIPEWALKEEGWTKDGMRNHFLEFAKRMIKEYQGEVEYWISFNEANVYIAFSHVVGLWPPGEKRSPFSLMGIGPFRGVALQAMDRMAEAHNELYQWAHGTFPGIKLGLAHNMALYRGKGFLNQIRANAVSEIMNWRFPESTRGNLDFFGFNYYGAEWVRENGIDLDPEEEYSEAGRAIHPGGLLQLLKEIHERFHLPVWITENGIADSTDLLRPAYLLEHLKAVEEGIRMGIPIQGYVVWTLSDNLEWSDGYCPKFGLVSVDRAHGLKRMPRESYRIYREVIRLRAVTDQMRKEAWARVSSNVGRERPFCRAEDGVSALPVPRTRKIVSKDWRFKQ